MSCDLMGRHFHLQLSAARGVETQAGSALFVTLSIHKASMHFLTSFCRVELQKEMLGMSASPPRCPY